MVPKLFGTTSSHSWISMLLKSPLPDSSHNLDPDPTINQSIDQYLFVAKKKYTHRNKYTWKHTGRKGGGAWRTITAIFFGLPWSAVHGQVVEQRSNRSGPSHYMDPYSAKKSMDPDPQH